jgi:hypothetical protein
MTLNIPTVLTIMALLLNSGGAFADGLSVDELLEQRNPASALDNLGLDERETLVLNLVESLKSANDARSLAIGNALCKSSAWTSAGDDGEAQARIWARMLKVSEPQDPLMYALDCAAANRDGFFRASTLTPLFNLRLTYCSGQPIGKDMIDELERVQRQMESFSASIETGLAKAAGADQKVVSFFPMRTALRLATVGAAKAVHFAQNSDWPSAKAEFRRTANYLRDNAPKDYNSPWGAWRYHVDFEFYANFYAWLGGDEKLTLERFMEWPAVVDDPEINASLPADLPRQIEAHIEELRANGHAAEAYVDWLYVERLLPGVSTEENECENWRRRDYDPRALARHLAECTNGDPPQNAAALRDFDACFHNRFQAEDWRVQYMSIRSEDEPQARVVIKRFIEALLEQRPFAGLGLTPEQSDEAVRILNSFEPYRIEGRADLVRMISDQGLTTEMRNALEELIDSGTVPLPWNTRPLFRRPTHF